MIVLHPYDSAACNTLFLPLASDCSDDDDCGGGTQKMAMEDSTSENEEPVPDMAVVVFAKHSGLNDNLPCKLWCTGMYCACLHICMFV